MPTGPAADQFTSGPNFKLGSLKKKCNGFQTWAIRYLVLDKKNMMLYYYHAPKDTSPRKSINLAQCTIDRATANDCGPKNHGFRISHQGSRDYIFVGTNAIVDEWIKAILEAKNSVGTNSHGDNTNPMPSVGTGSGNTLNSGAGGTGNGGGSNAGGTNAGAGGTLGHHSTSLHLKPGQQENNFSYNGPTLAVLPRHASGLTGSPPSSQQANINASIDNQVPPPMNPRVSRNATPAPNNNNNMMSVPSNVGRTTQSSSLSEQNNTTLVAGQPGNDTNSTLVAGQNEAKRQAPVGQPVPILIMTPDNKRFPPIEIPIINIIRVGRFVDKAPTSEDMITFKSKVISRNHAEIWSVNGEVYIRDTKSQSGTFLNAMRLSEPSKESKPYRLKPGDMIQFGVDYKNATEDNARCVSVRIDIKSRVLDAPGEMSEQQRARLGPDEKELTLVNENATLVHGDQQSNRTRTPGISQGEPGGMGGYDPGMGNNYPMQPQMQPMMAGRPPPMHQQQQQPGMMKMPGGGGPMYMQQQQQQQQGGGYMPQPNMMNMRPPMGPGGGQAPRPMMGGPMPAGMRPMNMMPPINGSDPMLSSPGMGMRPMSGMGPPTGPPGSMMGRPRPAMMNGGMMPMQGPPGMTMGMQPRPMGMQPGMYPGSR